MILWEKIPVGRDLRLTWENLSHAVRENVLRHLQHGGSGVFNDLTSLYGRLLVPLPFLLLCAKIGLS
jgi:hypothetical protein